MMSALKESRGVNLAWIIAGSFVQHAPGTKKNSVIYAGHHVTKIACFLGYCVDDEIKKCSMRYVDKEAVGRGRAWRFDPMSWGDWNTSLSEIERGNVWRDSMMIQSNYMLAHSMPIIHHLADQGNFAYPTYEPLNVPPYPYPYIPYPYPYTHYPNPGNQSNQGGSYGLGDDDYFTSAMLDFGGSSSRYAVRGSSREAGFNDDDMDE
ncbi:hypothetical protein Tco_0190769 [Tanacetum coccineum]